MSDNARFAADAPLLTGSAPNVVLRWTGAGMFMQMEPSSASGSCALWCGTGASYTLPQHE